MKDVTKALARKLGPLPAWGWLGIFGAAAFAFQRRHGAAAGDAQAQNAAAVAPFRTAPLEQQPRQAPVVLDPGQAVYDPETGKLLEPATVQPPTEPTTTVTPPSEPPPGVPPGPIQPPFVGPATHLPPDPAPIPLPPIVTNTGPVAIGGNAAAQQGLPVYKGTPTVVFTDPATGSKSTEAGGFFRADELAGIV